MFEFLCSCIQHMRTPGVQDVLRGIQQHTVCTDIQCFDTMQDAGFGHLQPTREGNYGFLILMTFMIIYILMNIPENMSSNMLAKPRRITVHTNREL